MFTAFNYFYHKQSQTSSQPVIQSALSQIHPLVLPHAIALATLQLAALFTIHSSLQQFHCMRSKERRTHRHQPQTQSTAQTMTPNPHSKYQQSIDKQEVSQSGSKFRQLPLSPQPKLSKLQQVLKENSELRREIIELKVHQFYHFDDDKLKQLIKQLEALRKEVKKYKETVQNLQLDNDFLRRTNSQLKAELEKEIQLRTKEAYAQDVTKCTLKYSQSKAMDNQITHISSSGSNFLQNTTLQDPFQSRAQSRSRKTLVEKCLSPRRNKDSASQSANEYLLYRRNKERSSNVLQRLDD